MAVHVYVKEQNSVGKKVVGYFSYIAITAGSLLLFWAFYPIVSFEIYSRLFIPKDVIAPIPASQVASPLELTNSVLSGPNIFSNNLRDFTDASLWFPIEAKENGDRISLKEYYLSISKLGIDKALVKVGGEDLSKSLIHYLPKSAPGESGNVVIFGHSTLPQLYNPKEYKSIFTYLPSMEKGDKVILEVGDLNFEYEIFEMFVVEPENVSVLAQRYDASYLTLITCVPPGTYWKRLIVRAKLTRLPTEL